MCGCLLDAECDDDFCPAIAGDRHRGMGVMAGKRDFGVIPFPRDLSDFGDWSGVDIWGAWDWHHRVGAWRQL